MEHSDSQVDGEKAQSAWPRITKSFKQRSKDGTIPVIAGTIVFASALRARTGRSNVAARLLAGAALIGIGIRQRRHHRTVGGSDSIDGSSQRTTGTSEQRADSHRGDVNPRGTATDRDIDQAGDSEDASIQFTEHQEESASKPDLESSSATDPRTDDDETTVDLSEASLADEASEAAGPSSIQSQPTQTDATEPEETPVEDSEPEDSQSEDTKPDDEETEDTSA